MSVLDLNINGIPSVFRYLLNAQLIREENVLFTKDGFYMIYKSISSILISKGIETFPDRED